MAFGNLTVDFKQLSRVPVRDRMALAQSPQASQIFGNLTPSQIAALFPDYYKRALNPMAGQVSSFAAALSGAASVGTGSTSGGGGTTGTSTASTAPSTSAGPTRPGFIDEIISNVTNVQTNLGNTRLPAGSRGTLGYAQTLKLTPKKKALLDAIATDSGGGYGTINYVARQKWGTPDVTDFTKGHPYEGIKGSTAAGRYQILASNYTKFAKKLGLYDPTTGKSDFSPEAQDLIAFEMAKDVYRVGTGGRKLEEDINNSSISPDQLIRPLSIDYGWHILKTEKGMNTAIGVFKSNLPTYEQELLEAQTAQPLPGTSPITGEAPQGSDVNIKNLQGTSATVVPQLQTFDPAIFAQLDPRIQEYYKTATDDEKKQLETAITKLGTSGVQEIMQRHPKATAEAVTGKVVSENMDTASNVSEMVNQDPLTFWKQRNPQGAKIDDLDIETLRTSMMAAMKLEADAAAQGKPKKVEIYGGESGVRYNPSKPGSRHGVNFKEALDVAIYDVDPNTGQKMKTKSGAYGNYSNKPNHGGIDPEGFALYHEFGQNAELARVYLANQGDTNYQNWALRQGGLFGDVEWDFMHIDRSSTPGKYGVSAHANPGRRGSVAYGYTETALRELGIDPNSDAGRRLMTGVIERFGGQVPTQEAIAEAAQSAFGQKPQPRLNEDTAQIVQTQPGQPLPGAEPQTATPPKDPTTGGDVPLNPMIKEGQTPNSPTAETTTTQTATPASVNVTVEQQNITQQTTPPTEPTAEAVPAKKLGGTEEIKEPNSVKESMSLVADGKEVAKFNKNEEVNVADGKINVQNEYQKKTNETQQKTDKGSPQQQQQNTGSMRGVPAQSTDVLRRIPEGYSPISPSAMRAFANIKSDRHWEKGLVS